MPLQNPAGTADRPTMTAGSAESHRLGAMSKTHVGTGWRDRIESMIERYPWPTLLLALGIGYMISRRIR
jgi:hypothetical protein